MDRFCSWLQHCWGDLKHTKYDLCSLFPLNLMKIGRLHLQSISLVLLFRGTSLSARQMSSWSLWILLRYRQQRRDDSMCWISDAFLFPRCGHYSPPRRWLLKPQQMQKRHRDTVWVTPQKYTLWMITWMDLNARSQSLFCSFLCAFWVLCVSIKVERKSFKREQKQTMKS